VWGEIISSQFLLFPLFPLFPIPVSTDNLLNLTVLSREVTTTQAAEMLNISRPYLAKLLDRGAIPSHRVGTHRRIFLADILAYQNQRHAQIKEGLQNLADFSQECGLYAIDYKPES
jgi:excisionase family DNA binding protein